MDVIHEDPPLAHEPKHGQQPTAPAPTAGPDEAKPLLQSKKTSQLDPVALGVVYGIALTVAVQPASRMALLYLFKNDFRAGPAVFDAFYSVMSIPWTIKPLLGLLSDSVPLGGSRRKSYGILMAAIVAVTMVAFHQVKSPLQASCLVFASGFGMAFLTVLGQGVLVEQTTGESLQVSSKAWSVYYSVRYAGFGLALYYVSVALTVWRPRAVLTSLAVLPCLLFCWVLCFKERNDGMLQVVPAREQIGRLCTFFSFREVWGPILFIFVFVCTPTVTSPMFYFQTDTLGFTPWFIGMIDIATLVAGILGIWTYHTYFREVRFRSLYFAGTIVAFLLGTTPLILILRVNVRLGIPDEVFVLVDEFIMSVVAECLWMPLMVLSGRICPDGVEATTYAMFLSVNNLGMFVSSESSALLAWLLGITSHDLSNLWLMKVITLILGLSPLLILRLVPSDDHEALRARYKLQQQLDVERRISSNGDAAPPPPSLTSQTTARNGGLDERRRSSMESQALSSEPSFDRSAGM
ncbi:unnamed protein product [Vitrella brassicaformis CCMP3155]|uniref:Uncharacterized protein n=2 Tax=Vitrella brassicaformis TaxID=1169539 RepID=A0A0G4ET82_VITBC|nr:unnamed protein product [Vitrella brassicaformis CCMP3155]|eukprot:CEM01301.1 unnamed protein product [Vitrella brassicaformis CCMP3155]